ncbi:LysR family transcriptional regulator [Bradyrhizobium sp. LHD-71]|uniref:LysR family transcriptional regulator n=1 Tax=Bradyrhizobium sp. LHD-71 TaxID=3072141 RepID=UPI00280E3690|nr:LysR family transcriptional regulator [Bradyrhizobium sp. LHD-71]MDQ8731624.1 LysR family transcriptional regulator [Bradyrhizobium sp. LHD-71]
MDKLTSLRAFVKVVEAASFSEAARRLRLSRSAVSKYVAELEEDLGVQLLSRTTRRVTPTENGQAYFERALTILADLDAADHAVSQLQATPRGLLRVNAPMSFGTMQLGPALAGFMKQYPELQIQLALSDEHVDPVQDGLDVTLRIAELESSSLIARKIMPIERAVCASPGYLKQHGTPKHPSELRDHTCLTYGYLSTGNQWKLTGKDGDHWINPPWTLCANNAEVLRDAAVAGCGVAVLPVFIAASELKAGKLRAFLTDYTTPPLTLYAIYPPTRHLAVKVRLFIDYLVATFARPPAAIDKRPG